MTKYKIIYNRKDCIGVFACAAISDKFWAINEDGKADLKNGILNPETGFYELEFESEHFQEALDSATVCPVNVIMIYKVEDGKMIKIYPEDK